MIGALAQAGGVQSLSGYLLLIGATIVLLVVAAVAIVAYRRRVLGRGGGEDAAGLMEQMRSLRDSGRMTPEEYDAIKSKIVRRVRGDAPAAGAGAATKEPARGVRGASGAADEPERRARPGFDLTGDPLPNPRGEGPTS